MRFLKNIFHVKIMILSLIFISVITCTGSRVPDSYHDPEIDFSALRSIAVMPFANLTRDKLAAGRVRDAFMNSLLATGVVYVIPPGEVSRGISRVGMADPTAPSMDEIVKFSAVVKTDAVVTGVVLEYGEVRSGTIASNIISVNLQMIEKETRKVVWTASTSKGGITIWDRLFGGGGRPMNDVTEAAIDDILNKLLH